MSEYLPLLPILLFSVIVHELAHGWMALRLGDPTARDAGRLTLNPVPHIDPVGSLLVPLLSLATAGKIFIAWARPVPINPAHFRRLHRDEALVSAIGPLSNIALAFCCTMIVIILESLHLGTVLSDSIQGSTLFVFLLRMFYGGIYLNVVLAVFNLIPVPPLDGSHLLAAILPSALAVKYQRIGFLGVFALILLLSIPAVGAAFGHVIGAAMSPFLELVQLFIPHTL
jgi:Zn-dependent protease